MITFKLVVDRNVYANLEHGFAKLVTGLEQDFGKLGVQAGKLILESLRKIADRLYQKHSTPWSAGAYRPDRLFARTGSSIRALRASVRSRKLAGADIQASLTVPGTLAVHEEGGVVRAKGGFLAIPLPEALDDRGVPLFPAPRYWADTFVKKTRRGNLVIFQRRGRGLVPLYALRRSITLKAKLGLQTEIDKELSYYDRRLLQEIDMIFSRK